MTDIVMTGTQTIWQAALALAETQRVKAVVIGDSVGVGWNATNRGTEGWVPLLRGKLQGSYGAGGGASLGITDELGAYWMHDTGWTRSGFANADGFGLYLLSAKGTVGETISRSWDGRYLEVYWKGSTTAGDVFTVTIDGGTPVNVDGSVDNSYHVTEFDAGTNGTHTVLVTGPTTAGKYAWICGAVPYVGTTGVSLINASFAGRKLETYVDGAFGTALDMLVTINPDLVIFSMSINDYNTQEPLVDLTADWVTAAAKVVTAGATMACIVNNDIQASNAIPYTSYRNIIQAQAVISSAPYISFYDIWGSYAVANANGLMGDATHASTAGHLDMANRLYNLLGGMAASLVVSPTEIAPAYDITLTDGVTTLGLIAGGADRNRVFMPDPGAMSCTPVNRTAIQTSNGINKYDDLEFPYKNMAQDDWTGGRGLNDYEKDTTRFYDSSRVIPTGGGLLLGPVEKFSYPGHMEYYNVARSPFCTAFYTVTGTQYLSISFTPDTSDSYGDFYVIIRGSVADVSNGYQVKLAVYSNAAGEPDTLLSSANATIVQVGANILRFVGLGVALVTGTTYHLVLSSNSSQTFYVGYNTTGTGSAFLKTGAGAWGAVSSVYPWFAFTEAGADIPTHFFEYKRSFYAVQQVTAAGNSFLYRNGWRGAADSNSGTLTKLIDATATFTAEAVGGIVLIIKGPGSEEETPWREVTAFDSATQLTVSPAWKITHTTETEYVIINTPVWSAGVDLGGIVTDVAVAGELVYFARGDDVVVARYQEYNNAGTWTVRSVTAEDNDVNATHLLFIQHPDDGPVLYGGRNDHAFFGVTLWKASVPQFWGPLYQKLLTITENNKAWDDIEVTNVTQGTDGVHSKISLASGFTTGWAAVQTLPAAVDLSGGDKIVTRVYSTVATGATDLYLGIDDDPIPAYDNQNDVVHYNGTTFQQIYNVVEPSTTYWTNFDWETTHKVYIGSHKRFNNVRVNLHSPGVNNNAATLSAFYWDGFAWVSVAITDGTASGGATMAQSGSIAFSAPADWEPGVNNATGGAEASFPTGADTSYYWLYFTVSANLDADCDYTHFLVDHGHTDTIALPALTANTWTWVEWDITPVRTGLIDYAAIRSVGLFVNTDNGAQDIYFGPMYLKSGKVKFIPLPGDARINKLVQYDGNQQDPRTNPWVVTENRVYEIQTQAGDAVVPIPLQEIAAFASSENGRAATVNDVYLYFNLGGKTERYFGRNLDDIGVDLDEGMPSTRQGTPIAMVSYPGQVFMAFDGGSSKYSSVLVLRGSAWYELYRAPQVGVRITDIGLQAIPGMQGDLLWVAMGQLLMYFYISPSPLYDSDYEHAMSGYLESAWIYAGMVGNPKTWKSMQLYLEADSATAQAVKGYYNTTQYGDWTLVGTYDTIPSEEIDLAASGVNSIRLKYKLELTTTAATNTPVVLAVVLSTFVVVPIKYNYRIQCILSEDYEDVNLNERRDLALGYDARVETALAKLKAWASAATVLTMNSRFSLLDNEKVILSAPAFTPVKIWPEQQIEKHLLQLEMNGL